MSAPVDLDERLREARPGDPSGEDLSAAAVRVLARVAMLEAGEPKTSARSRLRFGFLVRIAAVLSLLLLAAETVPSIVPSPDRVAEVAVTPPTSPPTSPAVPSAPSWVLGALAGDPLARQVALRGGPSARLALLDHAESSPDRAGETLSLLRAAGGIRSDDEAARVRRLAARPALRATAIDLLASAQSTVGIRHLGRLLVDQPDVERLAVDALTRAARGGRRSAAVAALLDGAEAGRLLAAAEAMRLVQGRTLDTLLDVLPDEALGDAQLVVAVREAPATSHDRLLRRAARGDERALRLVTEARLAGAVPLLADRVHDEDLAVATRAIEDLVRQHRAEAWIHVARATGGVGAETARAALREAPPWVLGHLERTAREDPIRGLIAVEGLASAGPDGFLALERLAERPALRVSVIEAAGRAEGDAACDLLAALASRGRATDRAVRALGGRVARGDERAGRALLALARESGSRQAVRLLARYGEALGAAWLERAAADATLPSGARASLLRALRRARGERPESAPTHRRGASPSPVT